MRLFIVENYTRVPGDYAVVEATNEVEARLTLEKHLKKEQLDFSNKIITTWKVTPAERPLLVTVWRD